MAGEVGLAISTDRVPTEPVALTLVGKAGASVSFDCAFTPEPPEADINVGLPEPSVSGAPRPVVHATPVMAIATVFPSISKTTSPLTTLRLKGVISLYPCDSSM